MEFHPQKCLVLKVSNKRNLIKFNYHIHNTLLKETDSAKYLGVNIDSKLKWTKHLDQTSHKANNILSFLKRNLNNCPTHIKAQCYNALVRPILEYGCVVWDPHHRSDIDRLEKIQKRAARFATNNYNFEHGGTKANMEKLGWKPLEERRAAVKVNMFFKARVGVIGRVRFNYLSIIRPIP